MADDDSILSFISNNWRSLLGDGSGAGPGASPPALPPTSAMPPPGGGYSPSGAVDGNALNPNPAIANAPWIGTPGGGQAAFSGPQLPGQGGGPQAGAPPTGPLQPMEENTGLNVHDQLPPGQPAGPTMAGAGFPTPPPGSAAAMPTAPGTASTTVPPNGVGYGGGTTTALGTQPPGMGGGPMRGVPIPTSTGPTAPGNPLNITPPLPRPPTGGGPPTQTQGSLAAALGLVNNQSRMGNAITAGMAGLGKGLTAVGNLRPGASGAQAFAAGAGGGLEGGMHQLDQQQAQRRQAMMDSFLMSSTAFKDMIAAQQADNQTAFRKSQGEYFAARAGQLRAGGGSPAYQNTPYWKTMKIEDAARAYEKEKSIILQKQWHQNGSDAKTMKEDTDNLNKETEAYRQRLYKSVGIDPNQAEKEKTRGQTKENPFETSNFHSIDEFHHTVPVGGYYKDENGDVKVRTKPPPGAGVTPEERAASAAPNMDDYIASQGEAA